MVDNPTRGWDRIPIYGWFFDNPGVPAKGQIEFTMTQRIKRTDGRAIYAGGARKVVEIGDAEQQDPEIRAAVKLAYKALAQAEEGAAFDEAVWEQRWDAHLSAAVFTSFWAADDPDITPHGAGDDGYKVLVQERLSSGAGKQYHIQPLIAHLDQPLPGINLADVEVPPGAPAAPAPVYAKGQPGGVAALDADGDVVNARGLKLPSPERVDSIARVAEVRPVAAKGAVTISWDDGWLEWYTVLLPILRDEFPHQAHTFAWTPGLLNNPNGLYCTTAQAQEIAQALPHCEIASHSQTHANLKDSDLPTRISEYDDSKTNIEAIFGVTPTTFVYPYGGVGQNATTDTELWGRYDRAVTAGVPFAATPMRDRLGMFVTPRLEEWNSGTHQKMLEQVRLAARQPVIVNIYSHRPGTTTTVAELRELFQLCDDLGVPVINIRDAYPGGSVVPNAFAEGTTDPWKPITSGAGKSFDWVEVTPPPGIGTTGAFHFTSTEPTGFIYAFEHAPVEEGRHYTFSGRVRRTLVAGEGSYTRLRIQPIDRNGANTGPTFGSDDAGDEWGQLVAAGTMPAGTKAVRLDLIQLNTQGESWFTHLHFGLTADGIFG